MIGVVQFKCHKCNKQTVQDIGDPRSYCDDCKLLLDGIIPQQYNKGYKHGKADARIVEQNMKVNRYMNVNNLNHSHDDFLLGFFQGFIDQKRNMRR